jgi:hypothetical protein
VFGVENPFFVEKPSGYLIYFRFDDSPSMEEVLTGYPQYSHSINGASFKIDAGSIVKIFGRTGYLSYFKSFHKDLRQHFIIENEIVAVVHIMDSQQHLL